MADGWRGSTREPVLLGNCARLKRVVGLHSRHQRRGMNGDIDESIGSGNRRVLDEIKTSGWQVLDDLVAYILRAGETGDLLIGLEELGQRHGVIALVISKGGVCALGDDGLSQRDI